MAELSPIDQSDLYQAIDLIINASGVLIVVLSIFTFLIGVLIGDAHSVYKWRKQQKQNNCYCPCCDYPVNEDDKGRGI